MQSIASFAEDLISGEINDIKRGKKAAPLRESPLSESTQLDIRETVVPDSFMKNVLGEEFTPSEEEVIEEDSTLEELVKEFKHLLVEAREVLNEITMVGSLGVNFAGPTHKSTKKKKKKSKRETILGFIDKRRGKKKRGRHGFSRK